MWSELLLVAIAVVMQLQLSLYVCVCVSLCLYVNLFICLFSFCSMSLGACVCLCVCVFIAPKLLSDATRYLSPLKHTHTPHTPLQHPLSATCYSRKELSFLGNFSARIALRFDTFRFDSIYAAFSMQNFHTLALINPQTAALVNMQPP